MTRARASWCDQRVLKIADPVEVVRANLAEWDVPHVEKAIFETTEPDAIVTVVDRFCRQHLGSRIAGYIFQTTSIGSTHGIRLEDGRHVVLKARSPLIDNPHLHMDAQTLATVVRVMGWLHQQGYPCPEPLAGPLPLGRGLATVERYLERGASSSRTHMLDDGRRVAREGEGVGNAFEDGREIAHRNTFGEQQLQHALDARHGDERRDDILDQFALFLRQVLRAASALRRRTRGPTYCPSAARSDASTRPWRHRPRCSP